MKNQTIEQDVTISNWTIFGAQSVSIDIHEYMNESNQSEYNSSLTIFLDDGEENQEKVITIITDIWNACAHCCALTTAHHACQIFDDIIDTVFVVNIRGDVVEEFSLTDVSPNSSEEPRAPLELDVIH